MAELVVTEFVTIDGVIEAGSHLLGRVTYESFAGAWPQRSGPFAEKINAMPKYVVTSTLDELEWENSTPVAGDVVAAVERLKRDESEPILVAGSQTLVHTLIENDLVDRFHLMVFPVLLGSGKRVFPASEDKRALELVETKTLPKGVQAHTYRLAA